MSEELRSILLGTAGLSVAAAAALLLTLARGGIDASEPRRRAAVRLAAVAVLLQALHFSEELATGFHHRFPEVLGLAPWSLGFFVPFNLFWLAVWALSIRALAARRRAALFPLWFLAIASVANGVGHPLLSLRAGGYFPGLATSPLVGVAGVLLFRRLLAITAGGEPSPTSA
jgi:hypothetical protein